MYGYYYNAGKTWEDVKLWQATKDNEQIDVQIDTFINADNYWNIGTFKNFAEEMKQVLKADYSYPIIIDEKHELVDGAHRIVHAYLDDVKTVKAVIIGNEQWPEPDYDEAKACEMAYLQKESKAKFRIGDTIRHKEEGNVFKILDIKDGCYEFEYGVIIDIAAQDKWELVEEPKKCMFTKDFYTDEDRKALCEGCEEECKYSKKGKPVGEDLEQAIDTYLATYFGSEKENQDWPFLKKMAIHFANWQKEHLMANAVDATVHIDAGGYPYIPQMELYDYDKDVSLAEEGEKVKVIVIKEG